MYSKSTYSATNPFRNLDEIMDARTDSQEQRLTLIAISWHGAGEGRIKIRVSNLCCIMIFDYEKKMFENVWYVL